MKIKWIRRIFAALLTALLLFGALPMGAARAETALAAGYVNAATLNMRKGPGTGNAIVATLARNTVVNVYEVSGTWLRIDVPATGKSGYVSGKYITIDGDSLSAYGIGVTTGKVHLRKEATSKSESLGIVANGAGVTVFSADKTTGWYKVKVHAGGDGYISPRYVKVFCLVKASPTAAKAAYVNASGVNLRKGPSTSYESLGLLQKNTAVTVLESSGKWYKLTVDATKKTGYVFASYVTIGAAATPAPVTGKAAYINASGVNFRTGPSTRYNSQGTLSKNAAVTVTGTSGNWTKLTVDATGKSGYVFSRYVTLSGSATPTPTPSAAQTGAGIINATGVNFRTGPSTTYTSLGLLGKNTAVTVTGSSGNWYKLTVDSTGKTGYVFSKYVTFNKATSAPTSGVIAP